jgi:hypothetical protein
MILKNSDENKQVDNININSFKKHETFNGYLIDDDNFDYYDQFW